MKRITHIITGLGVGGAERALYNLLTGGLQNKFDSRVISLMDEGAYGPLFRDAGIEVECLGMSSGRPGPLAVANLLRKTRAQAPDILQGWMYHGNLAASLARRFAVPGAALSWNIRTSVEGASEAKRSTGRLIQLGARISHGPDTIIYNSNRSRLGHEASGYAARKGAFIPNGFDTQLWRPDPSAKLTLLEMAELPAGTKIIGFVGRAHLLKDLPNLFSAFQLVSRAHPDCHLICVGRQIEECAPASLDRSRVTFLGQQLNIPAIMPGFDLLCLSSSTEGFPNVIGEAMACGVPCVSTDAGDAGEIIGSTGWLAPARNPVALAQALVEALSMSRDGMLQRKVKARERIESCYSLTASIGHYTSIYQGLADRAL
jgi:glycosyltransferase involved in cell wall biosynthesis